MEDTANDSERKIISDVDGILHLARSNATSLVDVGTVILTAYSVWAHEQDSPATVLGVGIGCLRRSMVELVGPEEAYGDLAVSQEILAISRIGGAGELARFDRIMAALLAFASVSPRGGALMDSAMRLIAAKRPGMAGQRPLTD